jgi:hypothetical protein
VIPRIGQKRSNSPNGLVDYLADTKPPLDPSKHHNVHVDPRIVGSNLGYTGALDPATVAQLKNDLKATSKIYPNVEIPRGAIWHVSLALHAEEGGLSDQTWGAVAADFMEGMGFISDGKADVRWAAVNHGPSANGNHHVHIVVNLIREDGTKADTWQDYRRSHRVCRELENKYGLRPLEQTFEPERGYTMADADASRRRGQSEPARRALELKVRAIAAAAADEGQFIAGLHANDLLFRPRVKDRTVTGYAVSLRNPDGKEIWFGGGSLAPDLTLPRLRTHWSRNPAGYLAEWQGKPIGPAAAPPIGPEETLAAAGELRALQGQIDKGLTPAQHTQVSRDLAGALAAASAATETQPGPLAKAARQAARGAATRSYNGRARNYPNLSGLTMVAVAAAKPGSPTAHAIMIRQLLNTFDALIDYRKATGLAGVRKGSTMAPESDGIEDSVMEVASIGVILAARALEQHYKGRINEIPRSDVAEHTERPPEIPEKEWAGMDGDQREQVSLEPSWRLKPPSPAQVGKLTRDAQAKGITLDNPQEWSRGQVSDAIDAIKAGNIEPGGVLTIKRTAQENQDRMFARNILLNPREKAATNRGAHGYQGSKGPGFSR